MRRIFQHTILWIVALSILNTSIDVADNISVFSTTDSGKPEYIEIESIIELVMDTANDKTLPDQKGNDQQTPLKKTTVFDFSFQEKKEKTITRLAGTTIPHFPYAYCSGALSPGFISFFSPPPDNI